MSNPDVANQPRCACGAFRHSGPCNIRQRYDSRAARGANPPEILADLAAMLNSAPSSDPVQLPGPSDTPQPPPVPRDLVTISEAVAISRLSDKVIRSRIRRKELDTWGRPGRYLVSLADLLPRNFPNPTKNLPPVIRDLYAKRELHKGST